MEILWKIYGKYEHIDFFLKIYEKSMGHLWKTLAIFGNIEHLRKFAQSTSRYYFVLQSLHKVLPSTTSHHKACTKYFPVPLRTTEFVR